MAKVDKPVKGFTAFFVELKYSLGGSSYVKFTTPGA